jgi:phosphoribosylformimino-5-aminoimidazole carboxamide ribotide isomerase
VWSVTGFWDLGKFSTHLNVRYRDDYVMNMPVPGSSTPTMAKNYTTVDYQASYAFDNGIDVVFEANNITDAANVTSYGEDDVLGEYKEFGRQFYVGVNYKF